MSLMGDYIIFLGEEVSKKYPKKTWEECMGIVTNDSSFEKSMGPIKKYHQMYLAQRRR